jgi:hypothetical protein
MHTIKIYMIAFRKLGACFTQKDFKAHDAWLNG